MTTLRLRLIGTRLGSRALKCQTHLLHSSDPELLTQTIKEMDTNELRSTLNELFPLSISPQPIDQTIAVVTTNNHLLGQFIRIFYEKAKRYRMDQVEHFFGVHLISKVFL